MKWWPRFLMLLTLMAAPALASVTQIYTLNSGGTVVYDASLNGNKYALGFRIIPLGQFFGYDNSAVFSAGVTYASYNAPDGTSHPQVFITDSSWRQLVTGKLTLTRQNTAGAGTDANTGYAVMVEVANEAGDSMLPLPPTESPGYSHWWGFLEGTTGSAPNTFPWNGPVWRLGTNTDLQGGDWLNAIKAEPGLTELRVYVFGLDSTGSVQKSMNAGSIQWWEYVPASEGGASADSRIVPGPLPTAPGSNSFLAGLSGSAAWLRIPYMDQAFPSTLTNPLAYGLAPISLSGDGNGVTWNKTPSLIAIDQDTPTRWLYPMTSGFSGDAALSKILVLVRGRYRNTRH